MFSRNYVWIFGHLGKDPVIRATSNGKKVANLSVATTESWMDQTTGKYKNSTEWHRVAVFSQKLVEVIEQHYKKGARVLVEGSLRTSEWKEGNQKHRSTEIVVQEFEGTVDLVDGKPEAEASKAPAEAEAVA